MAKYSCDNCDFETDSDEDFKHFGEIHHLADRLDIGGTVPAGECPECTCLVYLREEQPRCKNCGFWRDGICDNTDDSGLWAHLRTGPEFGCIHHSSSYGGH